MVIYSDQTGLRSTGSGGNNTSHIYKIQTMKNRMVKDIIGNFLIILSHWELI